MDRRRRHHGKWGIREIKEWGEKPIGKRAFIDTAVQAEGLSCFLQAAAGPALSGMDV